MPSKVIMIQNIRGLHARAASKFVKVAETFDCKAIVKKDDDEVCAQSIMGLLMLGASKDSEIEIFTSGPQEQEALEALADLINRKFDEE